MKRKRFPAEQIVSILRQAELGMAVGDFVRQLGISEQTFYRWKKQYAGMQPEGVREDLAGRKRTAEEAGRRAQSGQGHPAGRRFKKVERPALKREVVNYIVSHYDLKLARACRLMKQVRSTQYAVRSTQYAVRSTQYAVRSTQYLHSKKDPKLPLARVQYAVRSTQYLHSKKDPKLPLARAGPSSRALGLPPPAHPVETRRLPGRRQPNLPLVPTRRAAVALLAQETPQGGQERQARMQPLRTNDAWSMDFVADQLADGTKIRLLTIIDIYSRESLAIVVGQRLRGEDVVAALNRIVKKRPPPKCLFVDKGSEFSGQMVDLWAYHHNAKIDFSRPGKPTDNCFIETFNGSLRDECLNVHWFASLGEAQAVVEAWRVDYNEIRPHTALRDQTPTALARGAGLVGK
jgi:putative transposase